MISMVDLARQDRALSAEIEDGMREVMASGRFLFGPRLRAFEKEAESYLQVRHAVGCAYGDAGMVVTNDEDLGTRLRLLANHGSVAPHDHRLQGFNSRLDELQAVARLQPVHGSAAEPRCGP